MSKNLKNFNNIYADLAESAYKDRPNSFEDQDLKDGPADIDYSKDADGVDGGDKENLPNEGVVYLQPDEEGILTDEETGFNAYFLTDTETLNENTEQTYFVVRGSDKFSEENLNDWLQNNADFALNDKYIPQAKVANKALKEEIQILNEQAPNAEINVTGHSLGTMVSAQAVAQLYLDNPKDFEKIGDVVLWNGPDVTDSLKEMGLSDEKIAIVGENVTYYVNPFDAVSMLNRSKPYDQQFGTVNVIVPLHFSSTFDKESAHDFGEFQIDANGNPLVASESFHPELLTAGQDLAKLIDKTILELKAVIIDSDISEAVLAMVLSAGTIEAMMAALLTLGLSLSPAEIAAATAIYDNYINEQNEIIENTEKESKKWDKEHIPDYQKRIRSAEGADKIELRLELLLTVAQYVVLRSEEMTKKVETTVSEAKEEVQKQITSLHQSAEKAATYLTAGEVESMLSGFNMSDFWDDGIEEETVKKADSYQDEMAYFSEALVISSRNLQEVDQEGAAAFNSILEEIIN